MMRRVVEGYYSAFPIEKEGQSFEGMISQEVLLYLQSMSLPLDGLERISQRAWSLDVFQST